MIVENGHFKGKFISNHFVLNYFVFYLIITIFKYILAASFGHVH